MSCIKLRSRVSSSNLSFRLLVEVFDGMLSSSLEHRITDENRQIFCFLKSVFVYVSRPTGWDDLELVDV